MKSIKQQYIDLTEGRMSQTNFMRNLRMTMPQYVTNVTSFKDAVRILKNKGILTEILKEDPVGQQAAGNPEEEAKLKSSLIKKEVLIPKKGQSYTWTMGAEYRPIKYIGKRSENPDIKVGASVGKGFIFQFEDGRYIEVGPQTVKKYLEQDNVDLYPGNMGDEMSAPTSLEEGKTKLTADQVNPSELRMGIRVEMEHTDDPKKAEKIALDHLAENPFYYTQLKLSGVDTKALPSKEKKAIAKKKDETEFVDKANQMKPVKGIEKIKASANKAKKETNKPAKGVSSMSLVSKTVRGVKKMDATGEKMKTIKEAEEPKEEPKKPVHQSIFDRNARLTTNLTKLGKGEKITPPGEEEDTKASNAENKLREAIRKMIQKEIYDGRDNMTDVTGENN